jgi:hypothetical protein
MLRMSGVTPLVPVYAFVAGTGTTLPLALTRGLLCSDVIYISEIDLAIFNNSLIILNFNVPV